MTGDEYEDTRTLVETYLFPLLQKHHIRFVQLARAGHREQDGIAILDDSRSPQRLYLEGAYKLSDELRINGTVPQISGVHRCALKFKAFVIEKWLDDHIRPAFIRHAIGYNAEELQRIQNSEYATATREAQRKPERIAFGFNVEERERIARSSEYNTLSREAFYPVMEWGWTRQHCLDYLRSIFAIEWQKSACTYCPFARLRAPAIERQKRHPRQIADALVLELTSLALNPRGALYKDKALLDIAKKEGYDEAFEIMNEILGKSEWALYRVRRLLHANASGGKGTADRCVERLATFANRDHALDALLDRNQLGEYEEIRQIPYIWIQRRGNTYPTREELLSIAPATVETKARYGVPWFDAKWNQQTLFTSHESKPAA
jgi:hypothetical protein